MVRKGDVRRLRKHKICYTIVMKMEWTRTGRKQECGVFNKNYDNFFGNCSKECIINRDLQGLISHRKLFNLSLCNRTMCFALLGQYISLSYKKMGLQFVFGDKKCSG